MKAIVLNGPNDMAYCDVPVPETGPGMVKIAVHSAGICGSDVPRVLEGTARKYPIIQGHEFSGEIVETGPGVNPTRVGEHVCGIPHLPCFTCDDCMRGDYGLCRNYSFLGSLSNGAFADYIVVPSINAMRFSNSISYDQAVLFEPCTIAVHAMRTSGFRPGEHVAILGGGTVGMFAAQCARIMGARTVTVFDIDDDKLRLASQLCADHTINTLTEEYLERAMNITGGKGYPFIFEVAGQPATMQMIFDLAASHCTACFIGYPHVPVTFQPGPWENIILKEITLIGSRLSYNAPFPGPDWTLTEKYCSDGRLIIDERMIYRRFKMSDAEKAFDLFRTPGKVKGKIILTNDLF